MESNNTGPKRIVVPAIKVVDASSKVPSVNRMLDNSLSIIEEQVDRLRIKSRAQSLDEKEARVLLGYVKGLVEISKEEREREKADKGAAALADLSVDELLERAAALKKP